MKIQQNIDFRRFNASLLNFGRGLLVFLLMLSVAACQDEVKTEGPIGKILKNDCIKRSLGPNVVGLEIEFAYAMAIPPSVGKLVSASVEASIAGDAETWMEHRSYETDEKFFVVGEPSVNNGAKTTVVFSRDTCAATLRYYYRIPEAAKGKQVRFTFSVTASNGETVSYPMGPYTIAQMDIKHELRLNSANCFISIADMTVYDADGAAANPSKIDLIYLYRNYPAWGITFGHAFVSPMANPDYLPADNPRYQRDGFPLPPNVNNSTSLRKTNELRDRHLHDFPGLHTIPDLRPSPSGIYVDDIDLQKLDFTNMPNYAIDVRQEGGMWVETQDKKYRAYIYVNYVVSPNNSGNGSAIISMKRLTMP